MKLEIKYFTSTGNTLWMARFFKEYVEKCGHKVLLSNVEQDGMEFMDDSDMVGIFYPVWGSNLPAPIGDNILNIKKSHRKMFLIGNCARFSGDTGLYWKRIIEQELGYRVFYVEHVVLPMNVNMPWWTWARVPKEKRKQRIFNKAIKVMSQIADDVLNGQEKYRGKNPFGILGGRIQRFFEHDAYKFWQDMMKIDALKCNECGLCEKLCPTKSIQVKDKKLVKVDNFNNNCIFCARCYNLCPTGAYLIGDKSKDQNHYRRYKGAYPHMAKVIIKDRASCNNRLE